MIGRKYIITIIISVLCTTLFVLQFRNIQFPDGNIRRESHSNKMFVVVPGFSYERRSLILVLNNIKILNNSSSVDVNCVIYHYVFPTHENFANVHSAEALELQQYCNFSTYLGSDYAFYIKAVNPTLINMNQYSHVMILLDDVELINFAVDKFLDIMSYNNLTSATPAIKQGQFPCNRRENVDSIGGTSVAIEVFATVFTSDSFNCFWALLDPHTNFIGWGYDLYFPLFCAATGHPQRLGVISFDNMQAIHHPAVAKGRYTPRAGVNVTDIFAYAAQQESDFRNMVQKRYRIALPDPADLRELTKHRPADYRPLQLRPTIELPVN